FRHLRVAVLTAAAAALTPRGRAQAELIGRLTAAGGRLAVPDLVRDRPSPRGALESLVGQGAVTIGEERGVRTPAVLPGRGEARVAIGARSAVFAPLGDLGLVIVDEEHESAYKQDESPRYHGRDVAVMRARLEGAVALLGSATPSVESYHNAVAGKYAKLVL